MIVHINTRKDVQYFHTFFIPFPRLKLMVAFSKVSERDRLKPRRDPYWTKLSKGCFLGYRKMTPDSGTWLARHLDGTTAKQEYRPLGEFVEIPDHQRYDLAQKAATSWFEHLGKGGSSSASTVETVCQTYVTHLKESKDAKVAKDVAARFNNYVLDNKILAATDVSKLTPASIEKWRKTLRDRPISGGKNRGGKRSDSSLNRDMTCFRAALNLAFKDGVVTSDFAWRTKLAPIKNADKRREVYLDVEQRKVLVGHLPDDIANFLRALALIPLRPGVVARLKVSDYDKRFKTLDLGLDKGHRERKIALPDVTADFFASQCLDKSPGDPLLSRANGTAWDKDSWKHPIKAAAFAAKLPEEVTAYAMRHSTITDLIHGGLDLMTVAQLSATSLVMIDRHYGHLTGIQSRTGLSKLTI
jgi:integrase